MKTLDDLRAFLEDNEYTELAQLLSLVRYKATMWDKYNRENRITMDQAARIARATPLDDSLLNPHLHDRAFHDFPSQAHDVPQPKDASGATYTGHDEEDIPGEARKGEN